MISTSSSFSNYRQISPSIRNKKNLIFNGHKYPVDFDLFLEYSDLFFKNKKLYEEEEDIILSDEPIEIKDDDFQTFVKCCQNEKFELNESNIFAIRQLSYHYEVPGLKNMINEIISNNPDLVVQSSLCNLLKNQDIQQNPDEEKIISDNFLEIIDNNLLLKLPIPILDRILNNYDLDVNKLDETKQKQILEFLLKYLQEHKKEASPLFLNFNFDRSKIDILLRLNQEFSEIFDLNMINSKSLINIIFELLNDLNNSKAGFSNSKSDIIRCLQNKLTKINENLDNFLTSFHIKINQLQKIDELKNKINIFKGIYMNEKNRNKIEINQLNDNINQMKNDIQNKNDFIQNQQVKENDLKKQKEKLNQIISDITPQIILNKNVNVLNFNTFKGETQKYIISNLIEQNACINCQLFRKISDLLTYLSNEQLKDNCLKTDKNYIYIHTNNVDDNIHSINEIESIGISSYSTETLFNNNSLNSPEFIKHINNFYKIYVEIGYEEEKFELIREKINALINTQCTHLKIGANIFEFRSFEFFQNDKKKLYSVRIDSRVGDKISSGGKSKGRFENCSLLEILTIDNGIKYIEGGSFCSCTNLKHVYFGSSVEYIGNSSFNECINLTRISLPPCLNLIDFTAFENCNKLSQIEINPYVAKLRPDSFKNCQSLNQLIMSSLLTSTKQHNFENYEIFSHIIIPDSIKVISSKSFKECLFLKKITLLSSVTAIEDEAFYKCKNLEEICFNTSLKSIGKRSFYECSSLKEIYIPSSVNTIDEYAFAECKELEKVSFDGHSSLTKISPNLFLNCSSLIDISIPSSVVSIDPDSFKGCTSLLKIEIPKSVNNISSSSFEGCSSLMQVAFQSYVNYIANSSFSRCTSLTQIILESESSLNLISDFTLTSCLSLKQVSIPFIKGIPATPQKFYQTFRSLQLPGILSELDGDTKTIFDRSFIVSQSSNDIYNLINPNTNDDFCTSEEDFYIEIILDESVNINGVKIYSSSSYFPKSFDIEINGNLVKSITSASALNGINKEMKIDIDPVLCFKFRFIQKGPNWDHGDNYLHIKRFELLSTESKYSKGVFSTLVSSCPNQDPHKCPVFMSSSHFDFNSFFTSNPTRNICTYPYDNSWFQIELTKGVAILDGYRLKRCSPNKLKSYKIICTDDESKPLNEWKTLIEINEKKEDEHDLLDIYKFPEISPPVRFIRLIQTGKNWNNCLFLQFYHFDLFGTYI